MLKIIEKSWNNFWAAYWRIEHRHKIPGIFEWDKQLVEFIEHVCGLKPGQRVLDLGCGGGDQAKVFAGKGYKVVGIDIAPSLIKFAGKQFEEKNLKGDFLVGDMRSIDYSFEFDACMILSGTFGFFSNEENQKLLHSVRRALKKNGKVFIMFLPAGKFNKHSRSWSEVKDGWELNEEWFDTETSTYRSKVFIIRKDGLLVRPKTEPGYHANEGIRCYTVPEIRKMIVRAGLEYLNSYSDTDLSIPVKKLSSRTIRNIVVARCSAVDHE